MASFEDLFASAVLDVVVPDTSLEYPPESSTDEWLSRLSSGHLERKQAFFDEQLQAFLTIRIQHPVTPDDPAHPPQDLLSFLTHVQVSLEATYISSMPQPTPDTPRSAFLSAPPRMASLAKLSAKASGHAHHPSIFPPSTPNPTPYSADQDRRYAKSEGTLLLASIWGQDTSDDSREAFSLLWSEAGRVWVAVYRLALTVSFLRLVVDDPLLCLTVSTTLREKALALSQPKNPLAAFLATVGGLPSATVPPSPINGNATQSDEPKKEVELDGFEEVNLLEGLSAGPTFSASSAVFLPSSRLGSISRQKLFSLPPVVPPTPAMPSPSPMTAVRTAHPTLRKSFRKTLHTVSGFRVRMRTVFVPSVLLPRLNGEKQRSDAEADEEEERERREAGNEERTVVLCVEVENSGESGSNFGFAVEKVDVTISGEGAKATGIGWGEGWFSGGAGQTTFPLLVGAREQYNLLYAVSFLRSPEEVEGLTSFSASARGAGDKLAALPDAELQRAVTINIHGRPYLKSSSNKTDLSYPTQTFSSRWNCVLDLATQQPNSRNHSVDPSLADPSDMNPEVLPEPASPFPVSVTSPTRRGSLAISSTSNNSAPSSGIPSAGSKRHTLPSGNAFQPRSANLGLGVPSSSNYRASTSMLNPLNSGSGRERENSLSSGGSGGRLSYIPPSISLQIPRSPTTYEAPPPIPTPPGKDASSPPPMPMTPAYPSYPSHSSLPQTPMSQGPMASQMSNYFGPSVEIRREKGAGMGFSVPQTPGPTVALGGGAAFAGVDGPLTGGGGEQGMFERLQQQGMGANAANGEAIVVSIGLLPVRMKDVEGKDGEEAEVLVGNGKIHPLQYFTLDIFVFNRSEWTRRFEVSCPDGRRRKRDAGSSGGKKAAVAPGVLPMGNRVRIGPLLPSACQSVRMEFLAVTPGVHSIDTLTLTDIESGFSMNLRSVMDIVVHEPQDTV